MMKQNHWNKHAANWNSVGAPLKPCSADIKNFEKVVSRYSLENPDTHNLSVLLLGVTPEITNMVWPSNTHLLAVDHMMDMVKHVWTGNSKIKANAICSDWVKLPLQQKWADIIIGDGCFTLLDYPNQYLQALHSLKMVMADGAYLALRLFVQARKPETSNVVFNDLYKGKIANFHVFKWRLAMSMQRAISQGVCVGDIWERWNQEGKSNKNLAQQLNWPIDEINTINTYKNSDAIYYYPDVDVIRELFSRDFYEVDNIVENYELADRCPLLILKKN